RDILCFSVRQPSLYHPPNKSLMDINSTFPSPIGSDNLSITWTCAFNAAANPSIFLFTDCLDGIQLLLRSLTSFMLLKYHLNILLLLNTTFPSSINSLKFCIGPPKVINPCLTFSVTKP